MHSAKDLLKKLGFNEFAQDSVKEALLKNLQRASEDGNKADVIPVESKKPKSKIGEQLTLFDDIPTHKNG